VGCDGRWAAGKLAGVQWSPRAAETAALGAIGLGLALGALLVNVEGRLLLGAAAVLVLALVARDAVLRPRLSAGPDGVVVRTLSGVHRLPWPGLRVQVRTTRRWGVRSRVLELDTAAGPDDTGTLVLLGRRDLGADPEDVAQALRRLAL
jgi:hypothetical protein